tara:strand:+ start:81 stop:791 length:711 start_codon:yes stop_codon:yes gene_type:complete
MININSVYKFIQYISNKNQSGFLTPKDFNESIRQAVYEFVTKRYHNVKTQNQAGASSVGLEQNQKVTDDLRYLSKTLSNLIPRDGIINLPSDYLHLSTISYLRNMVDEEGDLNIKYVDFKVLRDNELSAMLTSSIFGKKITSGKMGVCVFRGDSLELFPKTINNVNLVYLKKPLDPVWGFDVVKGKPVYSISKSVDIELPDDCKNEIVFMCSSYLGINLREGDLISYSETLKNQGV